MQVLIAISGFCPRIGNVPCTTPFDFLFVISIHVPTWGTTLSISTNLFALIFQSTFPRGERQLQSMSMTGTKRISIHVPSWGTTGFNRHGYVLFLYFNPRSLVGNDRSSNIQTHLHRDFNPRSLVGNDNGFGME